MDWGMKNRLSRMIKPKDGHTVMLAVDHGYFMGPTTGLEKL
ncbi:MAG TPA: 3-hydroxy-5-phosphonooxypentane-2,4-dione thiolase LsrF, partial [Thermoplasmata archaeon]|nr:3-hydroxy-5-phosphonooxypentane-2,4-dione thiolase LsrF [Thermoplasmata archaeon]